MYTFCIAEDEYYVQKSIEGRIRSMGLELECAGCAFTGQEAAALYEKCRPDLFFVDIHMPQRSGLRFIEDVRKNDPDCSTLFIIISGYSDYEHMHRAIHAEVFDYLQKPISPHEFSVMIRRALLELGDRGTQKDIGEISVSEEEDVCEQICAYIRAHYREDLSMTILGEKFFLSPSHISHLFKSKVGVTPGKYLEDVRLENAEQLIRNTNLLITDIAELTGYHDGNYFAKCFRKKYQISPSEIRKEVQR